MTQGSGNLREQFAFQRARALIGIFHKYKTGTFADVRCIDALFGVTIIIIIIIINTLFNEGIHVIVTITLINLWPSTYILRTTKNYIKYMKYINI